MKNRVGPGLVPLLTAKGYRVIVPYLRGYGSTRFLSDKTLGNGQPSAIAYDIIQLMGALNIPSAIIGGFDCGALSLAFGACGK